MRLRTTLLVGAAAATVAIVGACGGFKPTATTGAAGGAASGATVDGKAIFEKNCAACHGPTGGGGIGPAFTKDAGSTLLQTFPDAAAQVDFVSKGSTAFPDGYGATKKKGAGAMPGFSKSLKPDEIEAVVKYERGLAGG